MGVLMLTAGAMKTKLIVEKPSTIASRNAAGHLDLTNDNN